MKRKCITFRVYPERKTLYFKVNVWPTKKAMREHVKRHPLIGYGSLGKFEALASGFDVTRYKKGRPARRWACCGEVNFHRGFLFGGVVSHEFVHAGLRWLARMKIHEKLYQPNGVRVADTEERLCHAIGRMVEQFTHHAYRTRIW